MKIPVISIVMPTYNASEYISVSIDSILEQIYEDFELIIIDDGSTDNTIAIISTFRDDRICLIRNDHDFIGSLNLGMTRARGKYIVRMDSDDIMLPNRLQIQYNFMEINPSIDVSGTWMKTFGQREKEMRNAVNHNALQLQSILFTPIYHPTAIFRKEVIYNFPKVNGNYQIYNKEYIYAEDYKLWTVLLIKGSKFANIPQILLHFRHSETQVTSVKQKEMLQTTLRIQNEYIEFIMEKIISKDEKFYDLLESSIKLYNMKKIPFSGLKQIVHSIYSEVLVSYE
ncbi:glycosyltransferase family 2 protein [Dysgonomonas sp. ZJ279]|uniref:glycosyltransferase family 2 protein n=1 Tax=Dysgonomonas sp. ZJ279 TaxID=2709796 RepID=UPI0013EE236D|nr:glycosyltransferase family 2 protein [Dysgonomonas sp. ZJ279]